ncbi:hypothetical protein [Nonomuraea aridisoli]|uniref:Uncharacterized protein n=1 Tax=Nonomuraea aridisoli TaxID=2070368 RepID=A0A2W2G177_9ACTN|nr:hypothetical protein [Nonomuraea aridisoli]PZG20634.1 hypothetical protein C1J01_09025 [Nonomuraea aridisoli]
MSGRLVGEVVEWLRTPAARELGLSQAERNVLFVIAERAHEQTRRMLRHRPDTESLFERIRGALDVSDKSLGNILGRLAKHGLEVRVPTGTDKRGRPTFASNGHSMEFRLPEFPASVALPDPQRSIDEGSFPVENPVAQPVDNPASSDPKVHQPMELHGGRSIDGWSIRGGRSIDGWTLSPSKESPSKNNPSTPGVPAVRTDVEGPRLVHREPSAGNHRQPNHHQPPLMLAVPEPSRASTAPAGPIDQTPAEPYDSARDFLATLPDLGSSYLEAARAQAPPGTPIAALVIHAARLARRPA